MAALKDLSTMQLPTCAKLVGSTVCTVRLPNSVILVNVTSALITTHQLGCATHNDALPIATHVNYQTLATPLCVTGHIPSMRSHKHVYVVLTIAIIAHQMELAQRKVVTLDIATCLMIRNVFVLVAILAKSVNRLIAMTMEEGSRMM